MSSEGCKFDNDLCRCCHSEGKFKNVYSPHYTMDVEDEANKNKMFIFNTSPVVYSDILRECFNIELLPVKEQYQKMVSAICQSCIQKLLDANIFKHQVLKCEDEFRKLYYEHVGKDFEVNILNVNIKEEVTGSPVSNEGHGTKLIVDHGRASGYQTMSVHNDMKFKVEVFGCDDDDESWAGDDDYDGTRSDDDENIDRHSISRKNKGHSKFKKSEKDLVINKTKKKRKASKQSRPSPPKTKTKRKVGRPRKNTAPSLQEEIDPVEDDIKSEETSQVLLQKDKDYKQVDDYVQCARCDIKLKSIHSLRVHVKHVHLKVPRYTCTVCSQVFLTQSLINEHKKVEHNIDKELQCKICNRRFNQKYYLNRHVKRNHSTVDGAIRRIKSRNVKPKTEPLPPENKEANKIPDVIKLDKRPALFRMQENVDYKIVGDKVQCYRCDKTAACLNNLRYHVKYTHLNLARYTCPYCPKTFLNTCTFTSHKFKEHDIDDRAKCNACNTAFNTTFQLKHHINSYHMLGKKYKCNECEYEGFSPQNLRKHKFKHKTVKEFHCRYCQKSFMRKATLICHEKIHTGEKNKVCKVCGEAFVQKASLNYHMGKYHPGVDF